MGSVAGRRIRKQFGEAFAAALVQLPLGQWHGPIASGYGMHLVLVRTRADGRQPVLDEVRDALHREWMADQRRDATEKAYQRLLQRYTVTIEPRGVATRAESAAVTAP